MLNSGLAVVAGFLSYGVVCVGVNTLQVKVLFPSLFKEDWSTESAPLNLLNLVLSFGYSILAGFVCVSLAGPGSRNTLLVFAGLQLATGIAVQRQFWNVMPLWYHIPFLVLIVPFVLLGGYLGSH